MISTVSSLPLNKRCFWTPLQATTARNSEVCDSSFFLNSSSRFKGRHRDDDVCSSVAARTRLRKLLGEESAAAAAAAASGPAEKSPWAKDSYDVAEFESLADTYEKLNWRIISKPGGATVKPPEYYTLYAHHKQATEGDNSGERPMWAEKGGIDFEGREKWDAWEALKGMDTTAAKEAFVKAYYEFPAKALYKDTRG